MTLDPKYIQRFVLFFVFLCLVSGCLHLTATAQQAQQVCFENRCFAIEIADEAHERQQGLMGRKHLAEDEGMLFIFEEDGYYSFWMKDMLIPLDIIWLDRDWRVVDTALNVPPCSQFRCPSYIPSQQAWYVLELHAGSVREMGLRAGDRLRVKGINL